MSQKKTYQETLVELNLEAPQQSGDLTSMGGKRPPDGYCTPPNRDVSHHQDDIFSRKSTPKPLFATGILEGRSKVWWCKIQMVIYLTNFWSIWSQWKWSLANNANKQKEMLREFRVQAVCVCVCVTLAFHKHSWLIHPDHSAVSEVKPITTGDCGWEAHNNI